MYVTGDVPHYGQGESIICRYIYRVLTVEKWDDTKSRTYPYYVHNIDPPLPPHHPLEKREFFFFCATYTVSWIDIKNIQQNNKQPTLITIVYEALHAKKLNMSH